MGTRRIGIELFNRIRETLGHVKISILLTQSQRSVNWIHTIFFSVNRIHTKKSGHLIELESYGATQLQNK